MAAAITFTYAETVIEAVCDDEQTDRDRWVGFATPAQSNIGQEPMITKRAHKDVRSATRFCVNHDWCFRGDNTKYKESK